MLIQQAPHPQTAGGGQGLGHLLICQGLVFLPLSVGLFQAGKEGAPQGPQKLGEEELLHLLAGLGQAFLPLPHLAVAAGPAGAGGRDFLPAICRHWISGYPHHHCLACLPGIPPPSF